MPHKIGVLVYTLSELEEIHPEVFDNAVEHLREYVDTYAVWVGYKNTMDKFAEYMGIVIEDHDTEYNCILWYFKDYIYCGGDIDNLQGVRLWKYLNKHKTILQIVNKIDDDPLTGFYTDYPVIKELKAFMDRPNNETTFRGLIDNCFDELFKAYNNEVEYQHSSEGIKTIFELEYVFDVLGNKFPNY